MPAEHLFAYILLGGLGCLLLVAIVRGLRGLLDPAPLPYFSKDRLLSKGELAFYRVLRQVIPPSLSTSLKVRLSDVIGCTGDGWRNGFGAKISQKHIDFVLIDAATTDIRLAIELDDRTHQRADRRERDTFVDRALATAGVPILRVPAAARYDLAALRSELHAALRHGRRG